MSNPPMNTPKVSIVVPVYNVAPYLRQCLDSIVGQTLISLQILCVNDGSTDDSLAILKEYAAKDARIEIIDQPNAGVAMARNAAMQRLKGEYTLFVDPDDWIDPQLAELTVQAADHFQADLVFFLYTRSTKQKNSRPRTFEVADLTCWDSDGTTLIAKKMMYEVACWNRLHRTSFLTEHDILFSKGFVATDMPFHWQCLLHVKRLVEMPCQFYHYRQRAGSLVHSKNRLVFDIFSIFETIKADLDRANRFQEFVSLFVEHELASFRKFYYRIAPSMRQEMRSRILELLGEEEWNFIQNDRTLPRKTRRFYLELRKPSSWYLRWRCFCHVLESQWQYFAAKIRNWM